MDARPARAGDASVPPGRATPRARRALLAWLLAVYGAATVAYILLPCGLSANTVAMGYPLPSMPLWQLALANLALVTVAYGAFAFAGDWLAGRAGIPGALPSDVSAVDLWWRPMALGLGAGAALVIVDRATAALTTFPGFPHPPFPSSLLASLTAGIGEEMAFRLFVLSLWAALLSWVARGLRRPGLLPAALGTANVLAAIAFAGGHLGSAVALAGVHSPADLPVAELVELTLLNGGLGLLAGRLFVRHGLPAAIGVHFWADIVWHVLFPLLS